MFEIIHNYDKVRKTGRRCRGDAINLNCEQKKMIFLFPTEMGLHKYKSQFQGSLIQRYRRLNSPISPCVGWSRVFHQCYRVVWEENVIRL